MSFLLGIIYLSFISLGLPDALLGSAWPNMYPEFQVPVSYAGMISMIIAFGTILSSLQSDRLTRRFGTGKVTAARGLPHWRCEAFPSATAFSSCVYGRFPMDWERYLPAEPRGIWDIGLYRFCRLYLQQF